MQKPIACTAFNRVYSINITDSSPFPFPIINISHDANKPITQELNIFSLTPSEFALKLVFIYFFSANWFPNLHHCDECNFFLRFFADFFFSTVVSTSFFIFSSVKKCHPLCRLWIFSHLTGGNSSEKLWPAIRIWSPSPLHDDSSMPTS